MSEHIKKIRTVDGDKQIDYEALANLPNLLELDDTLTKRGKAADAKAVTTLINNINLKSGASGSTIQVTDVSPLNHSIKVKVHGKNQFNGEVQSGVYLSNNFELDARDGDIFKSVSVELTPGTYTISFSKQVNIVRSIIDNVYQIVGYIGVNEFTFVVAHSSKVGFTFRDTTSVSTPWDDSITIQIERGKIATDYVEYINPSNAVLSYNNATYTPNVDGWINDLQSTYPIIKMSVSDGFIISLEYNQDISVVMSKIISLWESLAETV